MTRRHFLPHKTAVLMAAAFLIIACAAETWAVSPRPGLLEELKEQGRLEPYIRIRQEAQAKGVCTPGQGGLAKERLAAGAMTDYYIPCLLVDFSDNPATAGVNTTTGMFDSLLFSQSLNPTGSMTNYYAQNSYGQLNVIGVVSGWHRLPQTYAFYIDGASGTSNYPQNTQKLVEDAVDVAELAGFDFSQFDNNSDGFVDGVMVVVAGPGGEETGDTNDVHSHKWQIPNPRVYDGVTIRDFTIQPEEHAGNTMNSVGVFCHEWGHILGLPDLYDLDNCADEEICGYLLSNGIGQWSLMSLGNWLGAPVSGTKPAHLDAWCKTRLGFVVPTNIGANTVGTAIPAVEFTPTIFRLWANGTGGSQYFLVENRQRLGFDQYIPGEGLAIYHIDETMSSASLGNRNQWIEGVSPASPRLWVAVEQADGKFSMEKNDDSGDPFDVWYSDSAGFDHLSYPSTKDYNGVATQVAVWNISANDSLMTANFDVTFSRPFLQMSSYVFSDPAGNGNGVFEVGETFQLVLDLHCSMLPVGVTNVTVTADGSGLTMVDNSFNVGSMASGETISTASDPFEFTVPGGFSSRQVIFTMTATTDGGAYSWSDQVTVAVGSPRILIVDDDRGSTRETWYISALDSLGQVYRHWDVNLIGVPPLDTLLAHAVVMWFTGDANSTHPLTQSVTLIQDFLDAHGRLFLTGQDIAQNLAARADSVFLRDYLGVRFRGSHTGFKVVNAISGNPISDGLSLNMTGGAVVPTSPDSLALVTGGGAVICYTWFSTNRPAAVHIEDGYRAVFFAFGFEGVAPAPSPPFAPAHSILQRIIDWLDTDPGTGVFDDGDDHNAGVTPPKSFTLAQNYPNPFNAGTIIPVNLTTTAPRQVRLDVFDILGRRVRTLLNRTLEPGRHEVAWDGADDSDRALASGIYIYRLQVDGQAAEARRMVLLR